VVAPGSRALENSSFRKFLEQLVRLSNSTSPSHVVRGSETKLLVQRYCGDREMHTASGLNEFVSYDTNEIRADNDPTTRAYQALVEAYEHFNKTLFDNILPNCVITWQRKCKAYGFFANRRFKARSGDAVLDEIALNPAFFGRRTTKEILSTLVHEQFHLWQQHFGKPSRTSYHNKEWAKKMEEVAGLILSSTGLPGGAKTGQRVSHYIVQGGPFDRACDELLALGFDIEFGDRTTEAATGKSRGTNASATRNKPGYSCAACGATVWGKPGLQLICGKCMVVLVEAA
jgi:predicted SprT family Zn-dependent metalloprotease